MAKDNFNVKDYVDVAERIRRFYERHPEGRIVTIMETWGDGGIVFRASVYRDRTQAVEAPDATGWAHEVPGEGYINKTSALENCETSAIGRALANLGFPVRNGEPRPSRQEMEKARPMEGEPAPTTNGKPAMKNPEGPASDKQTALISQLMQSHFITEQEATGIQRRLAAGMTKQQASDAIEWLNSTIAERKENHEAATAGAA